MRGHTITEELTLITETCCSCGVVFAMTAGFRKQRLNDHGWFYCPAGHQQHYTGESEAEKQRKKAEALERQLKWSRTHATHLQDQLTSTQRSLSATKGVLTKTKKRIGNGVCPCCGRHFANVERHMKGQHPDYTKED